MDYKRMKRIIMSDKIIAKHRDYLAWEYFLTPGTRILWKGANQYQYDGQIIMRLGPGDYKIEIYDEFETNCNLPKTIDCVYIEQIIGVEGVVFADLEVKARWIRLAIYQFLSMNWGPNLTEQDIVTAVTHNDICKSGYLTDILIELYAMNKKGIVEKEHPGIYRLR